MSTSLIVNEAFHRYRNERPHIQECARLTADHIRRKAAAYRLNCQVSSRAKEVSSFVKKAYLKEYANPWTEITDKAGVRIIVQHSGLLDSALDLVKESFAPVLRVEDGRTAPGQEDRLTYPRLHVQVRASGDYRDPDGNPYECEVQIRTDAADVWSRMSHALMYKPGVDSVPKNVRRSLYRLIALLELYDTEVERGVNALAEHPDFSRSSRLLTEAERIYRTFSQHPYHRDLSQEIIVILLNTIDDGYEYGDQLVEFAELQRERLEALYRDYGPTSDHFLEGGRYMLASQPESLIIFERLANAKFVIQNVWEEHLPEFMLLDMAKAWGTAL